jgi:hypothetical protein
MSHVSARRFRTHVTHGANGLLRSTRHYMSAYILISHTGPFFHTKQLLQRFFPGCFSKFSCASATFAFVDWSRCSGTCSVVGTSGNRDSGILPTVVFGVTSSDISYVSASGPWGGRQFMDFQASSSCSSSLVYCRHLANKQRVIAVSHKIAALIARVYNEVGPMIVLPQFCATANLRTSYFRCTLPFSTNLVIIIPQFSRNCTNDFSDTASLVTVLLSKLIQWWVMTQLI